MPARSLAHDTLNLAAALVDGSQEVVALVDGAGHAHVLDGAALRHHLGYGSLELSSERLRALVHPEDLPRLQAAYQALVKEPGARDGVRYRVRHQEGHFVELESTAVNRLTDGVLNALVLHTRPASRPPADRPSGAPRDGSVLQDRAAFDTALAESVRRKADKIWSAKPFAMAATKDRRHDFAVLRIEIDRFRMLLGTHGAKAAQRVLEISTERILAALRASDVLARLDGAAFVALLRGIGDVAEASKVADRIQDLVSAPVDLGDGIITTAAIIGITTSDRRYEQAEDVLRDAELALNRAYKQHRRRRRAAFDTKIRVEDTEFMTLLAELNVARRSDQFFLQYQPIVTLDTGVLSGFEALVRWRHPERGTVPPGQFIPLAEETGFIIDLGQWVLREACRQMAAWQQAHAASRTLSMSVNISAEQLGEELLHTVESVLTDTKLSPEQLKLEITESAVMKNRDVAGKGLAMLRFYGVRLSLDDFGTGYASFSHLHQLPYDTLKIDREFVSRLELEIDETGIDHGDIVAAMINLAHTLNLDVVAEGVETLEQAETLKRMGCDYGQGYFFAYPLDADAAGDLIAAEPGWELSGDRRRAAAA